MKISFIIGTRPELIKVAPLIWAVKRDKIAFDVVNTAQHKDLLDPYWEAFGIKPTHVLDVMVKGQNLSSLTSRAISQIQEYLDNEEVQPTVILAQGDTTTVMAASMVSFYNRIKFAHLEAGLRSFDIENPFPEEFNRKIASISADYHFSPTSISSKNLLNEGISNEKIHEVGNTVVDALIKIKGDINFLSIPWKNKGLNKIQDFEKVVLITCHRRENHGRNLLEIIDAINEIAENNPETIFVWTVHPNPNVKNTVEKSRLSHMVNVLLTDPLEYIDILKILNTAYCAISDSGGIQEEAPSFGTPVLVLRKTTERPEGVSTGVAFLVGTEKLQIVRGFNYLKNNYPFFEGNPYGDGESSQRILDILMK
jgi:UDP-N-acetylglucosamine 2-epimerase (non-hydrolysing)